jgi:hypothetical protein
MNSYGSPVYSRAAAVYHAVGILQAVRDVQWRFETLQRMVDFPSLRIWSVFLPVCRYFLGWSKPGTHLAQLRSMIGLSPDDSEVGSISMSIYRLPLMPQYTAKPSL